MERWATEAIKEFINEQDAALQHRLERANHDKANGNRHSLDSSQYIVHLVFRFLYRVTIHKLVHRFYELD
jgi:hypothetical protein